MDRPLLAGTSPAPKQGPQKQGLNRAPALQQVGCTPFWISSRFTGTDGGIDGQGEMPAADVVAVQNGGRLGDVVVHAAGSSRR